MVVAVPVVLTVHVLGGRGDVDLGTRLRPGVVPALLLLAPVLLLRLLVHSAARRRLRGVEEAPFWGAGLLLLAVAGGRCSIAAARGRLAVPGVPAGPVRLGTPLRPGTGPPVVVTAIAVAAKAAAVAAPTSGLVPASTASVVATSSESTGASTVAHWNGKICLLIKNVVRKWWCTSTRLEY